METVAAVCTYWWPTNSVKTLLQSPYRCCNNSPDYVSLRHTVISIKVYLYLPTFWAKVQNWFSQRTVFFLNTKLLYTFTSSTITKYLAKPTATPANRWTLSTIQTSTNHTQFVGHKSSITSPYTNCAATVCEKNMSNTISLQQSLASKQTIMECGQMWLSLQPSSVTTA